MSKKIDDLLREVKTDFALEGITLSDTQMQRLRECALGKMSYDVARQMILQELLPQSDIGCQYEQA